MKHYIDKSALVAEIKRRMNEEVNYDEDSKDFASYADFTHYSTLDTLLDFINTLEVKEMDLEKEYDNEFFKDPVFGKLVNRNAGISIAKHFFELGLKSSIDKELVEEVYSHIDSIKDTVDRMTSGNFMHNRAAIKFSANTIAKVLELMGLKAQKGE